MIAPLQPCILHPTATCELFGIKQEIADDMAKLGQYMVIIIHNACVAPTLGVNTASFQYISKPIMHSTSDSVFRW
jgi:hypothetical protein